MIYLILAESSLELVPPELYNYPSILSHAKRLSKSRSEILLDNSWHYSSMRGIKNELKRGRPDLVHISLLAATDTPLYQQNRIKIYVHTSCDYVISLGRCVSIPRSYHRFAGLVEKLFKYKRIIDRDTLLLKLDKKTFPELVRDLRPSKVIGLSTVGNLQSFEEISSKLDNRTCIVVGGFPKGHFSESVYNQMDKIYSAGNTSYDAHVVVSRLLYEYEKTIFM